MILSRQDYPDLGTGPIWLYQDQIRIRLYFFRIKQTLVPTVSARCSYSNNQFFNALPTLSYCCYNFYLQSIVTHCSSHFQYRAYCNSLYSNFQYCTTFPSVIQFNTLPTHSCSIQYRTYLIAVLLFNQKPTYRTYRISMFFTFSNIVSTISSSLPYLVWIQHAQFANVHLQFIHLVVLERNCSYWLPFFIDTKILEVNWN